MQENAKKIDLNTESKESSKMADIISEIKRGIEVGYPKRLIIKSLELEGYSRESIKQAFIQIEKKKNGSNGNGYVVKTESIVKKNKADTGAIQPNQGMKKDFSGMDKPPVLPSTAAGRDVSAEEMQKKKSKHFIHVMIELVFGIIFFVIVGILIYLYLLPAVTTIGNI